jgi:hypothetical protein
MAYCANQNGDDDRTIGLDVISGINLAEPICSKIEHPILPLTKQLTYLPNMRAFSSSAKSLITYIWGKATREPSYEKILDKVIEGKPSLKAVATAEVQ